MNRISLLLGKTESHPGCRFKKLLGVLLCAFLLPGAVSAAPGDLDPGFGDNGINLTSVGTPLETRERGQAVVTQADGKLVVAGFADNGVNNDFALLRYNSDGTLDSSFGREGKVTTAVTASDDEAHSVIQQADGKLVVAGSARNGDHNFALARYHADGSLDREFGSGGMVTTAVGPSHALAKSVIQQADGKLVVAGYTSEGGSNKFALVRYNADGSLDSAFGSGGVVTTAVLTFAHAMSVIQQADGMLVLAGYARSETGGYGFALVRYRADGSLDSGFGSGGVMTNAVLGYAYAMSVIQQADGKLVVSGYSSSGSGYDFALLRYNADGSLDDGFGSGGMVTTEVGSTWDIARSVIQQVDGKLVVAGYARNGTGDYDFALARYHADGNLDRGFGSGGLVTTAVGPSHDYAYSLAQQADGKLVLAGYRNDLSAGDDIALARYNADGSLDSAFGSSGVLITAMTSTRDYGYSLLQQTDGKLVMAGNSYNGSDFDFALARHNVDGSLDSSFGSGGVVITAVGASEDNAASVIQQADGKLVVAGSTYDGSNRDIALIRYNADGSLDSGFGSAGVVTTAVLGASHTFGSSVLQQANGKLVVAGSAYDGTQNDMVLVRYNADGSLDNSFGSGGVVTTAVGSSHDRASSVIQQSDGKLVVAGSTYSGINYDMAVVRYNADGSLDSGFGSGGVVTTAVGAFNDNAASVIQQADGKLVVAGNTYDGIYPEFALVRYTADGRLDSGFGSGGVVTTALLSYAYATSVIQQADGKLVAAGAANNGSNHDLAIVRYNADGSVDGEFGSDGSVVIDTGIAESGAEVLQQADGKLVVGGQTQGPARFLAVRLQNGTPPVAAPGGPYSVDEGSALVLDATASSDADGTITSYAWDLDNDGDFTDASGATVDLGVQPDDVATYTIGLRVVDNDGNADTTTTTVTVTNLTPTASEQSITAAADSGIGITLTGSDVAADTLTFDVVTPPSNGELSGSGADLVYTPSAGFTGADNFTFTATDDDGGVSAPATVSITVTDQTAPVITLLGSATMTLEAGSAYSDPGAIASDNVDGDITGLINVSGSVDTGRVGVYKVTYSVSDAAGNGDTEQRSISVVDTTAPLVSAPGSTSIDVVDQSELSSSNPVIASFLDAATASDIVDGSLPVANDSSAQLSIGSNLITFTATDAAGNTGSAQSSITITSADQDFDGLPNEWEIEYGLDPDADDAALDLDGDGRSNLDEYLEGGDPTLDDIAPVLTAPADLTVDSTGPLTPVDLGVAVASDYKDGDLVATVDNPGPYAPGAYTLTWSVSDAAGNTATAEQQLTVLPQVSVAGVQSVSEGSTATVEFMLNGEAAAYPVTVPFSVSGTAMAGMDYLALSGELVIESGTSGSITVETLEEPVFEGRETIVLTLQAPTNAVLGSAAEHTITLLEENLAPEVGIVIAQGSRMTSTVEADGGVVEMLADVTDKNPDDVHLFDWSASDSNLVPEEGFASGSFTFAPDSLSAGLYAVALQVTDNGVPPLSTVTETLLRVIATAPELSDSVDSDGDGLTDAEEGLEDADMDRIPDYLDANTGSADGHLLPANAAGDLMQTEVGLRLRLGSTAYAAGHPYAEVGHNEIASFGGLTGTPGDNAADDPMAYYAGIFDFEVFGLQPGAAADVVIPQGEPLLAVSGYRKYVAGMGWFDFAEDAHNFIASAPGLPGICPAPGDDAYTPGITSGHHCLQLTIQDGGPNDADGEANGIIRDPGGAAADTSVAPQIQVETTMSDDLEVTAGEEVVVLAFSITSDSDDAEIHHFAFAGSGSGNEVKDIGEAALYRDQNGDGVPQEAEKIASATYEADDGELLFSLPEPQQIPVGQSNYLVVYQF